MIFRIFFHFNLKIVSEWFLSKLLIRFNHFYERQRFSIQINASSRASLCKWFFPLLNECEQSQGINTVSVFLVASNEITMAHCPMCASNKSQFIHNLYNCILICLNAQQPINKRAPFSLCTTCFGKQLVIEMVCSQFATHGSDKTMVRKKT